MCSPATVFYSIGVVLFSSTFSVKMAVFRISEKYPFVNRNFENRKF